MTRDSDDSADDTIKDENAPADKPKPSRYELSNVDTGPQVLVPDRPYVRGQGLFPYPMDESDDEWAAEEDQGPPQPTVKHLFDKEPTDVVRPVQTKRELAWDLWNTQISSKSSIIVIVMMAVALLFCGLSFMFTWYKFEHERVGRTNTTLVTVRTTVGVLGRAEEEWEETNESLFLLRVNRNLDYWGGVCNADVLILDHRNTLSTSELRQLETAYSNERDLQCVLQFNNTDCDLLKELSVNSDSDMWFYNMVCPYGRMAMGLTVVGCVMLFGGLVLGVAAGICITISRVIVGAYLLGAAFVVSLTPIIYGAEILAGVPKEFCTSHRCWYGDAVFMPMTATFVAVCASIYACTAKGDIRRVDKNAIMLHEARQAVLKRGDLRYDPRGVRFQLPDYKSYVNDNGNHRKTVPEALPPPPGTIASFARQMDDDGVDCRSDESVEKVGSGAENMYVHSESARAEEREYMDTIRQRAKEAMEKKKLAKKAKHGILNLKGSEHGGILLDMNLSEGEGRVNSAEVSRKRLAIARAAMGIADADDSVHLADGVDDGQAELSKAPTKSGREDDGCSVSATGNGGGDGDNASQRDVHSSKRVISTQTPRPTAARSTASSSHSSTTMQQLLRVPPQPRTVFPTLHGDPAATGATLGSDSAKGSHSIQWGFGDSINQVRDTLKDGLFRVVDPGHAQRRSDVPTNDQLIARSMLAAARAGDAEAFQGMPSNTVQNYPLPCTDAHLAVTPTDVAAVEAEGVGVSQLGALGRTLLARMTGDEESGKTKAGAPRPKLNSAEVGFYQDFATKRPSLASNHPSRADNHPSRADNHPSRADNHPSRADPSRADAQFPYLKAGNALDNPYGIKLDMESLNQYAGRVTRPHR